MTYRFRTLLEFENTLCVLGDHKPDQNYAQ
jgi:hypothetical protein